MTASLLRDALSNLENAVDDLNDVRDREQPRYDALPEDRARILQ